MSDSIMDVRIMIEVDGEKLSLVRKLSRSEARQMSMESPASSLVQEYFNQLRRPFITALTNAILHPRLAAYPHGDPEFREVGEAPDE